MVLGRGGAHRVLGLWWFACNARAFAVNRSASDRRVECAIERRAVERTERLA